MSRGTDGDIPQSPRRPVGPGPCLGWKWPLPTDPQALRRHVIDSAGRTGGSSHRFARRIIVSPSFVIRLSRPRHRTGSVSSRPMEEDAAPGPDHRERLKELIQQ